VTLEVRQIEPGIVRLELSSWRGRAVGYEVSAYLLHGVLVDSGFPGVRDEFLDAVRSLSPRGVVVTHWHEDHAGNVPGLAALGLPISMHGRCEAMLRSRPAIRLYRRVVWGQTARLSLPLVPFDAAPLEIIETPGHTEDHLVVWDAERRVLASGDLFLGVKVRVAHLHESPRDLLRSLRTVAALEPRILLDPHRGVVENATALLHAKIDWMEETIGQIRTLAAEGCGEREIQRRVLGPEAFVGWVSFGEYSKRSLVKAVLRES
jgi:glyoxylase-like metal-dependent hydrolase (beta-lactamase superfamily II)